MCMRNEMGRYPSCVEAVFEGPGAEDHGLCKECSPVAKEKYDAMVLQLRDWERAINAHCSCGGDGPGAGCVACEIYHDATGTKKPKGESCGIPFGEGNHCAFLKPCPEHDTIKRKCEDQQHKIDSATASLCPTCGEVVGRVQRRKCGCGAVGYTDHSPGCQLSR